MSTDARAVAEPLLGFADSLPAAAADTAAPAAMLHLLTFTLEREEFGIPVIFIANFGDLMQFLDSDSPHARDARAFRSAMEQYRAKYAA